MSTYRTVTCSVVVFFIGVGALWLGTGKWTAWTSESARKIEILQNPVPIGSIEFEDAIYGKSRFSEIEEPVVLLEFIFTRCAGACPAMGAEFARLQDDLKAKGIAQDVRLISISFDPQDDRARLLEYLERFGAETDKWTAAKVMGKRDLSHLLKALGVVVIPDLQLGYVHNTAVYVLENSSVVKISSFSDRAGLVADIARRLGLPS